jgi:PAS domain S-box-containing protein
MKDGLVWTDENGKIIEINESAIEMLGIIGKDVKGKNVKDIVNSYPSLSDLIKSALSMKKVPSDEEIIVESIDGINRLITSITAVKIDGGEYIGTIISLKNIKSIKKIAKNIASYEAKFLLSDIVGNSKTIRELKEYVLLIARSDSNILIEGESGTGKELIAHCIHNYSDRSEGPFVPINCAAIPPELFESILFGYEKGAFTGAKAEGSHGKFEIANGGTLFLDEIGELPFHMQSKLLRAISEGRIEKIGGRRPINVDVRLISATNKSLLDEIDSGRFRKDLYYRINVFNIKTPSLREIIDDIPLLVEYFIKKSGKKIKYISEDFYNVLKAYSWPGNVRELENILERAIHTSKDGIIDINSLPEYIINNQEFLLPKKILPLSEIERNVIKMALDICKGNKSKSAKLLGIGRDTLYRKIRSYHI